MKHNLQNPTNLTPSAQIDSNQWASDVFDDHSTMDMSKIWRLLWRKRKILLFIVLLSTMVSFTLNSLLRPIYTSTTVLTIGPHTGVVPYDQLDDVFESFRHLPRFHQTQLRLLKGERVATRVINILNLDQNPEFTGELTQRGFKTGLRKIYRQIKNTFTNTSNKVSYNTSTLETSLQSKLDGIISRYMQRLSVDIEDGTNLVTIQFTSFDPKVAAIVANTVIEAYQQIDEEDNRLLDKRLRKVLSEKLTEVQSLLEKSEKQLTTHAKNKGADFVDLENDSNLQSMKLQLLNQEYLDAQSKRIELSGKHKYSSNASDNALLASILTDDTISALEGQKAQLITEQSRLLEIYQPGYPKLIQIKSEIKGLDVQIARVSQKHINALQTQFLAAQDRESLLGKELASQSQVILDLKDRSIKYNLMKREWESNKHLYLGLLERVKQSGVSFDLELSNISIIEKAKPSASKTSPAIVKNTFVAGAVGFVFALGVIGLHGLLDRRIRSPEDLSQASKYPNLSITPLITASEQSASDTAVELLSFDLHSNSAFEETFRSLRTSLTYSLAGGFPETLMVTSSLPSEGKTTTIINLAFNLHKIEKKNILILDLDFRKPRIHKVFNVPASPGITDHIVGKDCASIYKIKSPNEANAGKLSILPAGTPSKNPIELLESKNFDLLFNSLKKEFDIILVDCPPVMGLADTMVIASKLDAVLVAVCSEVATIDSVNSCINRLESVNARIVGTVLTKFDVQNEPYYYKNYYSYQYDYKISQKG